MDLRIENIEYEAFVIRQLFAKGYGCIRDIVLCLFQLQIIFYGVSFDFIMCLYELGLLSM